MSIPRILVVDDQLAADRDLRSDFLADTSCIEVPADVEAPSSSGKHGKSPLAAITFCSGQKTNGKSVENSYSEIKQAVAKRIKGDNRWALVLQDVMFVSGPLDRGLPTGREGDLTFGESVWKSYQQDFPGLPAVMLTSKHQNEIANQEAPYLSKSDISAHDLAKTLLFHGDLSDEQKRSILRIPEGIAVASKAMFRVFCEAFRFAPTDVNVLLLGETGVGKEVVFRYIHALSHRSTGPHVAINVAAIAESLVESQLFGHEKGAFTGATEKHVGLFELASKGTLFLDEIGDMVPSMQTKVLRALANHEIFRVGSAAPIKIDVRLVSATHQNLPERIKQGHFREDLLYRINTSTISIPPLRERPEDIVYVAESLLNRSDRGIALSNGAKARLQEYAFPGNIRELEGMIKQLFVRQGKNTVVSADDLTNCLNAANHVRFERVSPPKDSGDVPLPPSLSLNNLVEALLAMPIDCNDPKLKGAAKRLAEAYTLLRKRLAGAALESTKDKNTGEFNRTGAVAYLQGESDVTALNAKRELNEILEQNRTADLSDEQIVELVKCWEATTK